MRPRQRLRQKFNWLHDFFDVIAPARCLVCLKEGTWLCRECAQALPKFRQRCIVCDTEKPRGVTCTWHGNKKPLTGVISAGGYTSAHLRRGVHWLKFRGVRSLAPTLARLLFSYLGLIAPLPQLQAQAVLVPIPLHRRRRYERGFNQSLDIAQSLSELSGIPMADILVRSRSTRSQAELPHEMRQENVAEAFALQEPLPDKRYVLLIDDVTTTGSTLMAAASAFAEASADKQVWGVTVARG